MVFLRHWLDENQSRMMLQSVNLKWRCPYWRHGCRLNSYYLPKNDRITRKGREKQSEGLIEICRMKWISKVKKKYNSKNESLPLKFQIFNLYNIYYRMRSSFVSEYTNCWLINNTTDKFHCFTVHFYSPFVFVPTNALFYTTLIQCQLLKHLKVTPTCFDH
jgi:hypothetical protein